MKNLTESPAVVFTAMYGMRPQRGRAHPHDAFRAIGAAVAADYPVHCYVIKAADSLMPLTIVSVCTHAGHVTGVYEIYGDVQ